MTSCLPSCISNTEKRATPIGSKFFPFRVDSFSEGSQKQFDRVNLR